MYIKFSMSHEGCPMTIQEDTSFDVVESEYNSPTCVLYKCRGCGTTVSLEVTQEPEL